MKLSTYSPQISWMYRGFIAFNIFLGAFLILGVARTVEFFIVTPLFTYVFWGSLFLVLGLAQLVSYIRNEYTWMRICLIGGMILQLFWAVALAARQFDQLDSNIFLLVMFSIIGYFKYGLFLYFPTSKEVDKWTRL